MAAVESTKSFERAVQEGIRKVLETFDRVGNLSAEQSDGIHDFIRCEDVLAVLQIGFGKSLLFQIIPGLCVEINKLGYSDYLITRKAQKFFHKCSTVWHYLKTDYNIHHSP